MKTLAAFFALVAALIFAPSLASPAQAQPCQWNYTAPGNVSTAVYCGNVIINGTITGANINTVSTIAALEAIPTAVLGNVFTVIGYGGGSNLTFAGGGQFVLAPGACNNSGAGDSVFQFPALFSASECWIRLLAPGTVAVNVQMAGANCDATTNDATPLQNAETAAFNYGLSVTYPNTNVCHILTPITARSGVEHYCPLGQNYGDSQSTGTSGKCGVVYVGASTGYAYDLELQNGTTQVQAPTFHDMYISSTGGCVRLNNPNNGFTNGPDSQEYMLFPRFDRVTCIAGTIGVQCSKCFYVSISNGFWSGTNVSIDMEGSDNVLVDHNELSYTTDEPIAFVSHLTFGNNDTASNNQIECPAADANGVACIYTSARNANIMHNFMECVGTFAILPAAVKVDTGNLTTKVKDNEIDCPPANATSGLVYNGDPYLLDWSNNTSAGTPYGSASFNSGTGVQYWINALNVAQVIHQGNSNEGGFPFSTYNNFPEQPGQNVPGLLASWSPGAESLPVNNTGAGATVFANTGAWVLPQGGGTLTFNNALSSLTGTLDVCLLSSGNATVGITAFDGATSKGTAGPTSTTLQWSCVDNVVYSTGANATVHSGGSGGNVNIYQVVIKQHAL